jgi:hypothetical protein
MIAATYGVERTLALPKYRTPGQIGILPGNGPTPSAENKATTG